MNIEAAPILRGREGDDVCASPGLLWVIPDELAFWRK